VKWQQGPQQIPSEGGAVGKRYAEKVKKTPTVMARNTSYKYQQNPIYRMYNPIEITSYFTNKWP
jgi:hypothetical protein